MSRDLSPEGARRMLGMHAAALRWPRNDAGGAAPGMGAPVSVASRSFVPRGQRPRGGLYLPAARLASAALEGRAGRFEGSLLVAFRGSGGGGHRGDTPPRRNLRPRRGRGARGGFDLGAQLRPLCLRPPRGSCVPAPGSLAQHSPRLHDLARPPPSRARGRSCVPLGPCCTPGPGRTLGQHVLTKRLCWAQGSPHTPSPGQSLALPASEHSNDLLNRVTPPKSGWLSI